MSRCLGQGGRRGRTGGVVQDLDQLSHDASTAFSPWAAAARRGEHEARTSATWRGRSAWARQPSRNGWHTHTPTYSRHTHTTCHRRTPAHVRARAHAGMCSSVGVPHTVSPGGCGRGAARKRGGVRAPGGAAQVPAPWLGEEAVFKQFDSSSTIRKRQS